MTPQDATGRATSKPARGNATHDAQGPNKPARRCEVTGCGRKHYAKGRCKRHYQAAWAAKQRLAAHIGTPLAIFPRHPKRITDALSVLAETPGLTLAEYLRRKQQILRGEHP